LKGVAHDFANLFEVSRGGSSMLIDTLNALSGAMRVLKENSAILATTVVALMTAFTVDKISNVIASVSMLITRSAAARMAAIAEAEASEILTAANLARAKSAMEASLFESELAAKSVVEATQFKALAFDEWAVVESTEAMTVATARNKAAMFESGAATLALTEANIAAVDSEIALTAALETTTVAATLTAGALGFLEKALALVGGPVGLAIIAAVLAVRHAFQEEGKAAREAATDIENFKGAADKLTAAQAALEKTSLEALLTAEKTKIDELAVRINVARTSTDKDAESMMELNKQNTEAYEIFNRLTAMLGIVNDSIGKVGGSTDLASKKTKDFIAEHDAETAKIRALNAVYMGSALAIKLVEIAKTAEIEKIKAHKDALATEYAAIDASIDQQKEQLIIQAKLADKKQGKQDIAAQAVSNAAMVQGAKDAALLAEATDKVARAQRLNAEEVRYAKLELDLLKNSLDAEAQIAAAKAERDKNSAGATDAQIDRYQKLYEEQVKAVRQTQAVKDQTDRDTSSREDNNRVLNEQIALNAEYAKAKDDAFQRSLKAMDAANAEADNAKKSAIALVDDFFHAAQGGATSFWEFFKQAAERTFAELISKHLVEKLMSSDAFKNIFSSGGGADGTTAGLDNSVFSPEMLAKAHPENAALQNLKTAGQGIAVAGTAFSLGNMVGGMTTNRALGVLGGGFAGAASGAAMGAQYGGPAGAIIGGVVGEISGMVGGFMGAKHAADAAAKALIAIRDAEAQVHASLADWRAQVTGTAADQAAANEADLRWKYLSLIQTIEQVEAGKKMEEQRNKDLKEAADIYGLAQKQLTNTTNTLNKAFTGMINAVSGYKLNLALFNYSPSLGPTPAATNPKPHSGSGVTESSSGNADSVTVNLVLDGKVIAKSTVGALRKVAQVNFGSSDKIAEAMSLL
jgi:hypothetical protein